MIVAMLRVKDEARWIADVLNALKPVCERIFVMDDHSADGTAQICRELGATVYDSPFGGFDEARDKDWLLRKIEESVPFGSWVLCIDGDEVLHPDDVEVTKRLAQCASDAYRFRILYLWDNRETVRVDGVYGRFSRPSMFRLRPNMTFRRTAANGNLHCSSVPAECVGRAEYAGVRLLHLGYMDRSDRLRKYDWYTKRDPGNQAEDGYRHMVVGDIFPADSVFRYGGPLKLEAINA